jgi:flavin-dependent dehydrogenase
MKVAIYGAGLAGSYLYRLLITSGFDQITVFENKAPHQTSCGINPCAWATSRGFEKFITDINLDPQKYILQTFDKISMNEMNISALIMVIDKPKLIADLLDGANVKFNSEKNGHFDRIIDATGFARAYLPKIDNDIIASCLQYRVYSRDPLECGINVSDLGYVWRFPLSKNEYHIGAGSITISPRQMLNKLGWLKNCDHLCSCVGRIRFNSPHYSLPFVDITQDVNHYPVWGVGEAIGCVAPLAGEGIIPGLTSARLLLKNWDDPDAYRRSILKEFLWMKKERSVIDKAMQGKRINLFDARILKKNTKRLSANFRPYQALRILKSLVKFD